MFSPGVAANAFSYSLVSTASVDYMTDFTQPAQFKCFFSILNWLNFDRYVKICYLNYKIYLKIMFKNKNNKKM